MTDNVDLVRRVLYRSPRVLGLQCFVDDQGQGLHEFTVQRRSDLRRWVLLMDPQFVRQRAGAAIVCACLADVGLI